MNNRKSSGGIDKAIEDNLRKVYTSVSEEPVPDRFAQLLAQLKEQDKAKDTK